MTKQTHAKNQNSATEKAGEEVVNNNPYTQEVTKDAFGEVHSPIAVSQDSHNPYSTQNITENTPVESAKSEEPVQTNETTAKAETPSVIEPLQPTVTEGPIKPTLTDQVVFEDLSQESTVKVKNENGVTVKLSGTAAQILKNLDATTKIVK
jgi:hypothetical protein